jgi:hypothetical protein
MSTSAHILHGADLEAALAETKADQRIASALITINAMATFVVTMGGLHWLLKALWP